jgi:hypothetical protein
MQVSRALTMSCVAALSLHEALKPGGKVFVVAGTRW